MKWAVMLVMTGVLAACGSGDDAPKTARVTTLPRIPAMTEPATQDANLVEGFMKLSTQPSAEKVIDGQTFHVLPSGVMYRDLKVGEGEPARIGQVVSVRYTARHMAGDKPSEVFESNQGPAAQPRVWALGTPEATLAGWQEGVSMMKKGGRRQIIVPPELAYGKTGVLPNIQPNETLMFELELENLTGEPHEFGKKPAATEVAGPPAPTGPSTMHGPVTELPDGLKIEDLHTGTGAVATKGKKVTVHYTGWLTNGTKFDSSRDRKSPFPFTLGVSSVIQGWHEGVDGMKVGGLRRLTIPPALGYRDETKKDPMGRVIIPANSTLVFEVELLRVE